MNIGWETLNPVVSYANRLVCDPGFSFGPRVIRDHQFIYVAAGRGRSDIGGRRYAAEEGDLFYYGPDVKHRFEADETEPFILYGLHFAPIGDLPAAGAVPYRQPVDVSWGEPEAANESGLQLGDGAYPFQVPERTRLRPSFAEPFFAAAARHYRTADALHHLRNRALLIRFLTELYDWVCRENEQNDPAAPLLESVRTQLRERAAEPYRREWLKEWTHYHENHAAALFSRLYGQSPHDYFLDCKLELAKTLLLADGLGVEQTARRLHFGSIHHFTRLFKRRIGCPPSLFRRMDRMV
ncbi:AraC family transcriptional regulator [Cohnella zeiphila]|uniref:Helix-turn-helix transcriptional regulator n=1 Tax=Cohnella zeiphila TaxID=2761120 RepID=A0A7X0SNX1_9BACL|nr:AraC family transcriptional regulator [Cohnella zeiphila]MBB6732180.1 helix-turn-helix transcriptional regulator [Cohnella zeiphila]